MILYLRTFLVFRIHNNFYLHLYFINLLNDDIENNQQIHLKTSRFFAIII